MDAIHLDPVEDGLSLPSLPLLVQATKHAHAAPSHIAVIDVATGRQATYGQLLTDVVVAKRHLLEQVGLPENGDLRERAVVMVIPNGYSYVVAQWAIWAAGGICVPLCPTYPLPELLRAIHSTGPCMVLTSGSLVPMETALKASLPQMSFTEIHGNQPTDHSHGIASVPRLRTCHWRGRRALIIFTSGTMSQPKGCVLTHQNITVQVESLTTLWEYTPSDHLIHVSPLFHVSGLINGLVAGLWAGATVELHCKFQSAAIWDRWQMEKSTCTIFCGVPTIYISLLDFYRVHIRGMEREKAALRGIRSLRLLTNAAGLLPPSARTAVCEIAGQPVLEEYGCTETGMALSNGLAVDRRIAGSMGWPLPGVQARLVDSRGRVIAAASKEEGELQIKGQNVFLEYWQQPEMTSSAFTDDGWFRTGDIARRDGNGAFYIYGRAETDWIKSGGHSISALEVEHYCLSLAGIQEAVVVGVQDEKWGQRVAAIIKQVPGTNTLSLLAFRAQLKQQIASYKVPTLLRIVDRIDRNVMGKVDKKAIARSFWPDRVNGCV